ncbi:protein transporter Sec31 [Streptomyces sp. E11-3]|uniref:protein transporter Sec31 n=1 Tax=Streptomyces sp. E11-3 TaxID=3110112 RepID=UPI00397FDB0B
MKTRPVQRSRLVPHTVNGKTEMVLDRYTVEVPVPPRDWDRTVLTAVTAVAGLLVAIAVVWSTASIGDLLSRVTIAPAAYAAAVAFDLAWILCMAVEWLARYDPARAALPRNMGHGALAVAMVAVGTHGWLAGQEAIGIIGAVVSGIVKALWTVVLRHHAKPLDDKTQQWVDKQRAEAGGELAMVSINRELTRARGLVSAEALALGTSPDTNPEPSGQVTDDPDSNPEHPDAEVHPIRPGTMTTRDAVRNAVDSGIRDEDAVLRYVRQVADPDAKLSTVERYLRGLRRSA